MTGPPPASLEPRAPRRRLTVPVLLLIVGVSLVGIAAIFFLLLAWIRFGIEVKAIILGGITIATMVIASLVRRRSLTATAEAIAVLGVILLALDAWAVRLNDLLGSAQMPGALYAGIGMLVVGVICRVWARFSGLRSPDLAAVLAAPIGLGLVVGGATSASTTEAVVAGLLGASAGGLLHALPAPWSSARPRVDALPERVALAVIGVASLVCAAAGAAFAVPDAVAVALWSTAVIAVLGIAHAVLLRPRRDEEPLPWAAILAGIAASTAAVVAALLGWQLALRTDLPVHLLLVGPVVAIAVPVVLDRAHARIGGLTAARISAAVIGALSLLATLALWLTDAVLALATGWGPWRTQPFAPLPGQVDGAVFAAIAAMAISTLLFLAPSLSRSALRNGRLIAASLLLLTGAAVVAVPALLVGTAVVIVAGSLVLLTRPALRVGAGVAGAVAALTAFSFGTAAPWLWLVGVGVAIALPIVAQIIVRPTYGAAALTIVPVGVATVAAIIAPAAIGAVAAQPSNPAIAYALIQWIALVCAIGAVVLRCPPPSRTALAVSSYVLFVISLLPFASTAAGTLEIPTGTVATVIGEPALAIVRSVGLLLVFSLIVLARTRVTPGVALAAAALVAPLASTVTFVVLRTFALDDHTAAPLATVGAAVTVVWVAAVWSMLRPVPSSVPEDASAAADTVDATDTGAADTGDAAPTADPARYTVLARALVDGGAFASILALAWAIDSPLRWSMLAMVAAAFVGASVSRGWAAPFAARLDGVPTSGATGVTAANAPRRLLLWPAFVFAIAAWWSGLPETTAAASLTAEAYLIPPAVALLAFAAALVWLRRHGESAVAIGLSFWIGLVLLGVAGWFDSPVRSTVVALVSAGLCLLLTCTLLVRARPAAITGATIALVALGVVTVERSLSGVADPAPAEAAWILLLLATAYVSAVGAARVPRRANRRPLYAAIIPPIAVGVSALLATGYAGSASSATVLAVALVVFAGLHIAAAAIDLAPFGVATRWTAIAAATIVSAAALLRGDLWIDDVLVVELVSLPLALTLLTGSAVAQWRRHRAGLDAPGERVVWMVALVLTVLPSIFASPEPLRVWLVVLVPVVTALAVVLTPLGGALRLRVASAVILAFASLAMGTRVLLAPLLGGHAVEGADIAAMVAGAGAVLVAAALIRTGAANSAATGIAAAGAGLLDVTLLVSGEGDLAPTALIAILAAGVAVCGAALLTSLRWRGFGAVLASGALLGALIAVGTRFALVLDTGSTSIEPDLWVLIALGIAAAVGIVALRSTTGSDIEEAVAATVGAVFAVALAAFAIAEILLLGAGPEGQWRTLYAMTALTVAGVIGLELRPRLGWALPITAAAGALAVGGTALFYQGITPVELVTVPPALGLVVLGARTLRRDPAARSWPALGPGLALLTVPSLLHDFTDTDLWRVVALGLTAIGMIVVGAVMRLQAPLVLGSVVVLVHAVAQLWPWISAGYSIVPWWLWLGIGGAALIYLAARYERSLRAVRNGFTAVTSLR